SSKNRATDVTGAPVITSWTEPTSDRPASSTTRPAAMAIVGSNCSPNFGPQEVQRQRRCGGNGPTDRVLEEKRQPVPIEEPVHPVDQHGAQRADQTDDEVAAQGAGQREREAAPGQGGDPALVRVGGGDDSVEFGACRRRWQRRGTDVTDEAVDSGQSTEID